MPDITGEALRPKQDTPMGCFQYPIEIGDPAGRRFTRLNALVDTGASYTLAPASLLIRLGVARTETAVFAMADGSQAELDIGETRIRINGKQATSIVVFGDEDAAPLLGAHALEGLRLGVDPLAERLIDVRALLFNNRKPLCVYPTETGISQQIRR